MKSAMHDERWLKEKYDALPAGERPQYAFISCKLKRFRTVNRLFGRAVGDELIEKFYDIASAWLGGGDYIANIRLDYFNLLVRLPRDYDDIFHYVIALNRQIRDMPDERFQGKIFTGFGIYPLGEEPVDFYTAQYNADVCRAECPESSFRNSHFEVYGLTYQDSNLKHFDLAQIIKPAIDRGEIKLYLQPKVDLKTGEISSAEALVRWIDPEKGIIPVSEFLPGLEELGLTEHVDLYLFELVCRYLNRWISDYGKRITISVNLSRSMFNYRYYFEDYKKIHQQYDTPKDCIEFELIESIVLNQVERVREVVDELHEYGFRYSLDDFGSGYSSYSVLTNTDFSMIKIDRSLFQNEGSERERILIRHIVETAHELGMKTVAEGVETPGYVDYLRTLGCDYIQGFVYYRPMPAEEFEARFVRGAERVALSPLPS